MKAIILIIIFLFNFFSYASIVYSDTEFANQNSIIAPIFEKKYQSFWKFNKKATVTDKSNTIILNIPLEKTKNITLNTNAVLINFSGRNENIFLLSATERMNWDTFDGFQQIFPMNWSFYTAFSFNINSTVKGTLKIELISGVGSQPQDFQHEIVYQKIHTQKNKIKIIMNNLKNLDLERLTGIKLTLTKISKTKSVKLILSNPKFILQPEILNTVYNEHIIFGENPASEMTIIWQTHIPSPTQIQIDTGKKYNVKGTSTQISKNYSFVHKIKLKNLLSNHLYTYQILLPNRTYGPKQEFKTAETNIQNFSFGVGGDSKNGYQALHNVLSQAQKHKIKFFLYDGDCVDVGGRSSEWDLWFSDINFFADKTPLLPCNGNHEMANDNNSNLYKTYYDFPNVYRNNYYFDYGNCRIVVLDSENNITKSVVNWLKNILSVKNKWKIAMFHRPPFSSGLHGPDLELQQKFLSVLYQYGTSLLVNGHDHLYERTKPIIFKNGKFKPVSSYGEGISCVVSGGLGAGFYSAKSRNNWWTQKIIEQEYHYINVTVSKDELQCKMITANGDINDSWIIHRPIRPTPPQTSDSPMIELKKFYVSTISTNPKIEGTVLNFAQRFKNKNVELSMEYNKNKKQQELVLNDSQNFSFPIRKTKKEITDANIILKYKNKILDKASFKIITPLINYDILPFSVDSISVDSTYEDYTKKPLCDGIKLTNNISWQESAWASKDTHKKHFVSIKLKKLMPISKIKIFWAYDSGKFWTSQAVNIYGIRNKKQIPLGTILENQSKSMSQITFTKTTIDTILIEQPADKGPKGRETLMWIREIEAK